jgi:hypothetical protein
MVLEGGTVSAHGALHNGGHHHLRRLLADGELSRTSRFLESVAEHLSTGKIGVGMALVHISEIFTSEKYDPKAREYMKNGRAKAIDAILDAVLLNDLAVTLSRNGGGARIASAISEIRGCITEDEKRQFGGRFQQAARMLAVYLHPHRR